MRAIRIAAWLALGLAALVAGCGTSPPSRFYTLDSTAKTLSTASADYAVLVGPVTVPSVVDRPEFVVLVAPNRVEIDQFNRWAAPLAEGIARTVADDLATLLGTSEVATAPFANFDADYRVTINVQRFESSPGQSVRLDAVWSVRRVADGQTRSGRSEAQEAATGEGFDALAAAHSRAVAKLSGEIATAIGALVAAS
jgi:uncharacterized lipoprotein YmbA